MRPPGRREAKIKITERQYSVLHSDWSRAKLVIFILEMDQSENRTWRRSRCVPKNVEIIGTKRDNPSITNWIKLDNHDFLFSMPTKLVNYIIIYWKLLNYESSLITIQGSEMAIIFMNSNFTQFVHSLQAALRYGNKALSEESVSGVPWSRVEKSSK